MLCDKYDMVVPYGFNCATASQLEVRGLRSFSGPLDWIDGTLARESFHAAVEWLDNSFAGMLDYADLTHCKGRSVDWLGCHAVQNAKTHFLFPHEFRVLTKETHKQVAEKYLRRIRRFDTTLKHASGNVLVVSCTTNPDISFSDWKLLLAAFQRKCPGANVNLYAVQFSAKCDERRQDGDLVVDYRTRRFKPKIDMVAPSDDWAYLNEVSMPVLDKDVRMKRNAEKCDQLDRVVAAGIGEWRRYFFSPFVSFKQKRGRIKNIRLAQSRGMLKFNCLGKFPRWCLLRFIKTRNPCWLLLV